MDYNKMEANTQKNEDDVVNITAFIPKLTDENHLKIYRLSRTVRLLSILDCVLTLFICFYGNIGYYFLIRLLCSTSGYFGAKKYNYHLSLIYLTFLVLGTIGELLIIYLFKDLEEEGVITHQQMVVGILYQLIIFLLRVYLTRFVCIFNSLIYSLEKTVKNQLINYDSQPVQIIYW